MAYNIESIDKFMNLQRANNEIMVQIIREGLNLRQELVDLWQNHEYPEYLEMDLEDLLKKYQLIDNKGNII